MAPMAPKKAPLVICGVNINAIYEPAQLHQLLQTCQDFDEKNKIFARLMDIMPGGPADDQLLPRVLEQLGGSLRRQRRPARRASEGAVSDSGTESGEDAGEIGALLQGLRDGRRRPSLQLVSEAMAVLGRLRESLGGGEDSTEVLQLVDRLQSSLKQKVAPVPPPRRGAHRRGRRAQTVGITREELAEIRRRLAAARKPAGTEPAAERRTDGKAETTDNPGKAGVAAPAPKASSTLYSAGVRPFSRRLSQETQGRRVASPQRLRRGPPPPPWLGARRDPASSSVQRVVAAVNASNARPPSPPPRRAARQPRPHTIGANEDDFSAIRAAIDSELKREVATSQQEEIHEPTDRNGPVTESANQSSPMPPHQLEKERSTAESQSDRQQVPSGRREQAAETLVPQHAIVHESRGQYAQSSASRVQRQGDVGRPAVEASAGAANASPSTSPCQRSPRPSVSAGSPNPRASLTSALTKQMTKEYLSDSSRVSREQVLGGSLSGHQSAVPAPDPTSGTEPAAVPAPQPPPPAQTSDPVSEPAAAVAEPEDAGPAQYTCSIITQETQTAELPPPSPTAGGAPSDPLSSPGAGPPALGHHQQDAVAMAPPVVSPSSPVSRHPPWARQARVAESVSPEGTSPTPSSQPIWARHGRSARPASAEVPSPPAGGGQLPWTRHTRPTARASSVTRMASAFNAADAPPPPLSSNAEDRRTRMQKTRSLYAPSGGPESGDSGSAPMDGPLDSPQKPRKMAAPEGPVQRHALARSKSAEHLFGRDRKPLKQTPFHKFENMERQRETQMAALRAEQRAQREHQQQLQQQFAQQQQQQQQKKQLLLQQQQHQFAQQQQHQHHPPGIAVIPHQRTIPDRLHGQQSQNHTYQNRPAAPQQHVSVHGQDTTDSCQGQSHAPHQPAVQHGSLTTAGRPPLSSQHHPQPVHHQPIDTRPSLDLQAERADHNLHHQGPHHQPQGSHLVQSPTHQQSSLHQQGSIHPQGIQYQQGPPPHAPSLPPQHGPQYSQVLPQQEIHPQGPSYYHQHPCHGQSAQLFQDQGHQQVPKHYSGPHQPQSAQYYPQEYQAHIHSHSYLHAQGLQHQTGQHAPQRDQSFQHHQSPQQHRSPQNIQSPQYQQISQQEQSFQQQKSPQPPISPQYPSSSSQQQGAQHHLGPYQEPHQHHQPLHQQPPVPQHYHQSSIPQHYQQQPSVPQHHQQPSDPQQHQQVGSAVFRSPPQLSPSAPLSPSRAAPSDSLSPRSGQPSSLQAADRGFRPPADSARHSGVFVPVTAAADTEGESRPPWAGSRSTGRVKQRAASLSGAEPPPRPDLAAGRPPSGDFGRHVSAFASTGHGRVPPRAVIRQSSWDSAPDLRTGPLVRAAAGQPPTRDGQPDLRARAKQQQLPPTDHRPDLRTAPQTRISQHPPPQKEHGSDLRTAPLARASQQEPPQTNHGPDLHVAPLARASQQQQLQTNHGPDLRTAPMVRTNQQQHQQQHHHQYQQHQHQQHQHQQPPHPPPATLRTGGPRSQAATGGGGGLQRSSSSDVLRCGGGMRPYEARLDAASAQQKKRQLDSFFQEREDEQLARSFDDLLDDEDLALVAPAGKSAGGSPHALAKSHTVGDMRSARRRPTAAGGSFARRQHAWESSTGASMAVGLGSYAPPPQKPPPAAEKASNTARSASKSRNKKIDEDTLDLVRKYFAKEGM